MLSRSVMIDYKDQRVGVFIDVQNMYYSARNLYQRKVNFATIVTEAVGDRKLVRAYAYVVRTKTGEETAFIEALQKQGIRTREKDLLEYFSGQKKADWDVGLTIDVVKMLDLLDVVVIVSGDGDFVPLVQYVQSRGRLAQVMSFRESTSGKLVEAVDTYVDLGSDKKKFLIGPLSGGRIKRSDKEGGPVEETPADDAPLDTAGGAFEAAPDDEPEEQQEERRGRRLSF